MKIAIVDRHIESVRNNATVFFIKVPPLFFLVNILPIPNYTAICSKCQYRILRFGIIFLHIVENGVVMLYKRIRDLREDKDLTQREMAKNLNCSQQVYSNYELGQRDIPTDILIKLSNFYGVSVDYILGISDNPKKQK